MEREFIMWLSGVLTGSEDLGISSEVVEVIKMRIKRLDAETLTNTKEVVDMLDRLDKKKEVEDYIFCTCLSAGPGRHCLVHDAQDYTVSIT